MDIPGKNISINNNPGPLGVRGRNSDNRFIWGDVRRIRRVIREGIFNVVQINGLANSQGAVAARLERVRVAWQILDNYPPMALRRVAMPVVKWLAEVVMCMGQQSRKIIRQPLTSVTDWYSSVPQ